MVEGQVFEHEIGTCQQAPKMLILGQALCVQSWLAGLPDHRPFTLICAVQHGNCCSFVSLTIATLSCVAMRVHHVLA